MRKRLVPSLILAVAALSLFAASASAKTPKVGAILQAQADVSPVGDYIAFNVGVITAERGCSLRPVQIRRDVVIDSVKSSEPYKSRGKWYAGGTGEFRPIAGYVTRGETLRATIAKKTIKHKGKVAAVCKPASVTFVVP